MRILITLLASLTLGSCGSTIDEQLEQIETPAELEELRSLAYHCLMDVDLVSVEHSDHCVATVEGLMSPSEGGCEEILTDECFKYNHEKNEIYIRFNWAINKSLINFGVSDKASAEVERYQPVPFSAYFQPQAMRAWFNKCLEEEQAALDLQGLRRVHSFFPRELKTGQMCIRRGYPEFKTEKL